MIFEAREVKPYAEPVPTDELKIGDVYFGVQFLDIDGIVPQFVPRIYIGMNLEPGDEGKHYFQDFGSYRNGIRYEDPEIRDFPPVIFETGAEKHTYTYETALEILLHCSLRRRKILGNN
jgi:hypothetical protein